jgi:hypothetical protein
VHAATIWSISASDDVIGNPNPGYRNQVTTNKGHFLKATNHSASPHTMGSRHHQFRRSRSATRTTLW